MVSIDAGERTYELVPDCRDLKPNWIWGPGRRRYGRFAGPRPCVHPQCQSALSNRRQFRQAAALVGPRYLRGCQRHLWLSVPGLKVMATVETVGALPWAGICSSPADRTARTAKIRLCI